MVVLLPVEAPDGTPVFVNPVEGLRTPEQLAQQAEDAQNSCVVVDAASGEIRRKADGVVVGSIEPKKQDTQE